MAKKAKKTIPKPGKANRENPYNHIAFNATDLQSIERDGGSSGKVFVPVTKEYRSNLKKELDEAIRLTTPKDKELNHKDHHIVVRLRQKAVAKTYRPLQFVEEARVFPAGHAGIDEMLIAVPESSFDSIDHTILERSTKKIIANLSTIEKIEAWDVSRRAPEGLERLRNHGRVIVKLFQYGIENSSKNSENYLSFKSLLSKLSISTAEIYRGKFTPIFSIPDLDKLQDETLTLLLNHPVIRYILAEPIYKQGTVATEDTRSHVTVSGTMGNPTAIPTVAVFDTGVGPNANAIKSWVTSQDIYVLPPDTDYVHGTQVASLIAGAAHFNKNHAWIPTTQSAVHNVAALETNGSYMTDLELRLRTAVDKRPDIKVWNLSLGGAACDENLFSDFSMALDELSDRYNVLFVVASGNYLETPRRGWPNPSHTNDRISTPSESVRALTVASITHADAIDSLSSEGHPTPYSRRGPGPTFTPKPDLCHVGGGVHKPWEAGTSSLSVLNPDNTLGSSFGTSFAAPIVSSMAAHIWRSLEGHPSLTPNPSLVKALLIHSAQLSSPDYSTFERRYYGSGRPEEVIRALYDSNDSFTLVFQAQIIPGMRWRKAPYPIPASLRKDGKFRGEIIITAAYAPPLDPSAGSEYVRANVSVSFGVLDGDTIKGKAPVEGEEGVSGFETIQIKNGGKWAPVKTHRKPYPEGISGDTWAIQIGATLRAFEPEMTNSLPVAVIVTLRSLDGDSNVYADGMRQLGTTNWTHTILPTDVPVRT